MRMLSDGLGVVAVSGGTVPGVRSSEQVPDVIWQDVHLHLGAARQVHALRGVSVTIRPGERVALVGANGSGKSTLLRAVHGLLPFSAGQVQGSGRRQAMLFQKPFHLRLTALQNVRLPLWLQGQAWGQTRAPALEALARVQLEGLAHRNARALSGGQQQRLALARAWAQRPEIWLLDEPTASLDPGARQEVEALIQAFAGQPGATLLFSSHQLGQVRRLARRVLYMEAGRVLADLPVDDFFNPGVLRDVSPSAHAFVQGETG